jgi:anti-sigma B factor antagonist
MMARDKRDAALGEPFDALVERHGDTAVLRLRGVLAAECAEAFEGVQKEIDYGSTARLIVDISGLTFIDSSGLQMILSTDQRCRQDGVDFALIPGTGQVNRALELAGLHEHLTFVDEPSSGSA